VVEFFVVVQNLAQIVQTVYWCSYSQNAFFTFSLYSPYRILIFQFWLLMLQNTKFRQHRIIFHWNYTAILRSLRRRPCTILNF